MVGQRHIDAPELPRQGAGAEVARGADFQANGALRQERHESRIGRGGDAMADALRAENLDGIAHRVRAADLAGVNEAMQAVVAAA